MSNKKLWAAFAALIILAMSAVRTAPAGAQITGVKEKPPMYSYIAVWNIPRAQWAARENQAAAARKILDRAISDRTIVAYGFDENPLHDTFWLAMSRAGLQSVADQFHKAGITTASPAGTTPPAPSILVSRYYNWHVGLWKNAYVHVGIYKLRPDAPPGVVDTLSQNFFAPPLEKMLSDGAIFEWETDTYADPKDAPGTILIAYLSDTEEGLNKAGKAVQETLKSQPLKGPAFDSLVDVGASRDVVVRSYAVYK
ncbi:MAG TPA: hypothetical protein VMG30_05225 [Acidobacteriota bacterium]|nr:hypothetical protein [Acidobacteriota bacterium]